MTRFIFFTKTDWSEPPRLRHQLAMLLVDRGHQILFFEKPNSPLSPRRPISNSIPGFEFLRTREGLHHKLRLSGVARRVNAVFEVAQIRAAIAHQDISDADVIVNFNYDYYFLREIFPNSLIVTVINDDFWCRALFGYERPLVEALSLTCKMSDEVLTVSCPLMDQLSKYCDPELFLPWSATPYCAPRSDTPRNQLLFWGYINNRLNFDYLIGLAAEIVNANSEIELKFVGPIQTNIDARFNVLAASPCVSVSGPVDVGELDFEGVLAALIPYVDGNRADDVTSIPNKAFPMLAHGLPLVISGMPNFIREPFVLRVGESPARDLMMLEQLRLGFARYQSSIERFVANNQSIDRYNQIMAFISEVEA